MTSSLTGDSTRPRTKDAALRHWRALPAVLNPLRYMLAIPYRAEGSKYGACGIRIDGNPEFVDAVLGKLKDLIDGENKDTRLELSIRQVDSVEIAGKRKDFDNRTAKAEVCYIRLHERGRSF